MIRSLGSDQIVLIGLVLAALVWPWNLQSYWLEDRLDDWTKCDYQSEPAFLDEFGIFEQHPSSGKVSDFLELRRSNSDCKLPVRTLAMKVDGQNFLNLVKGSYCTGIWLWNEQKSRYSCNWKWWVIFCDFGKWGTSPKTRTNGFGNSKTGPRTNCPRRWLFYDGQCKKSKNDTSNIWRRRFFAAMGCSM